MTLLKNTVLTSATLALVAIVSFGAARATPIAPAVSFDFSTGASAGTNQTLGSSQTYTSNGVTITAYSGTLNGTNVTLAGKLVANNRGTGEQGLGVLGGTSEIDYSPRELVQLDISNLLAAHYSSIMVYGSSVTDGEKLDVYSSTSSGGLGSLDGIILSDTGSVSIFQNGTFLNFVSDHAANGSDGGDVLLRSLTAVPEPMSMALLGVGMIGTGAIVRRRRSATTVR